MQEGSSIFQVPGLKNRQTVDNCVAGDDFSEIYEELNAIAEEIEQCRLRNS